MPAISSDSIRIAAIGYPQLGVSLRKQMASNFQWKCDQATNRTTGVGRTELPNAYSALVALSVGESVVARQWLRDPTQSKNDRYVAAHAFDSELKILKSRLLDADSKSFEKAVATIFFLNGFAPLLPTNTGGPDIICMTPGGQVVLVECTMKTSDVMTKVGKLVDRREALKDAFQKGRHGNSVTALLVCQAPRARVSATPEELARRGVLLVCAEELNARFDGVQVQGFPDVIVDAMNADLANLNAATVSSTTP